jgi:SAM-dependent methyltransferase
MQSVSQEKSTAKDSYNFFPDDAFERDDESDDALFYEKERIVQHLDSVALSTVENIIGQLIIEESPAVLDLMASWDSHLPESLSPSKVIGLGLNRSELAQNPRLSEAVIHDINANPRLPFEAEAFDAVINTVSVDYMVKPFDIFAEVGRILKPHGLFLVIFSNRMFPPKAVKVWREAMERERVGLVKRFFESTGLFEAPEVFVSSGKLRPEDDKYAHMGLPSDPIYAVYAEKKGPVRRDRPRRTITIVDEALDSRKNLDEKKSDPFLCPHCGQRMNKWMVPNSPFSDWDTEFLYICFNDSCPYLVRGWQVMSEQGIQGKSYRFVYDPERKSSIALPILSLNALKEGIVE